MKQPRRFGKATFIRLVALTIIGGIALLGTTEAKGFEDCEDEWLGCVDECDDDGRRECETADGCVGQVVCIACVDGRDGEICEVQDM